MVRRELGVKIWWCSQQTSQYHFVESVGGEVGGFDVDINYLRGDRLTPQKEIVITGSGSKLQAVVYWDDNDYGRAVCSVNRVWGEAFFGPPKNQIFRITNPLSRVVRGPGEPNRHKRLEQPKYIIHLNFLVIIVVDIDNY